MTCIDDFINTFIPEMAHAENENINDCKLHPAIKNKKF
jgi:hypothetical protein